MNILLFLVGNNKKIKAYNLTIKVMEGYYAKKEYKKLKIVEISIFITIVLFVFAITAIYNEKTVKTNTELLSNKKIGWGIKRNDNHEQPDVGSANKNVLEQYNGIALGNNEKNIFI